MVGLTEKVRRDFDGESALVSNLPGYAHREEQVVLACEIAEAFDKKEGLLSEAETGTGKTLAYLIPALRSSDKILISTHTRALQDQLVHRDLPAVQKALGIGRKTALIKGRSNYLCPYRLKRALSSAQLEGWQKKPLLQVHEWSEKSSDGDLASLGFDAFAKSVGTMVTATAEQCLGSACEMFDSCPLMQARQKAQTADIVVTNHSLLLADAALKSGEYGEILPSFDAYVLDEAHSLPELASRHFGIQMTRLTLINWLNDLQALLDELGDEAALKSETLSLGRKLLNAWEKPNMELVEEHWCELFKLVDSRRERCEEMEHLAESAGRIAAEIGMVREPDEGYVSWSDGEADNRRYVVAPVETGPLIKQHLWERPAAFVLLSATLRVFGSFEYSKKRLGLEEGVAESFHPSPFDYARQAMIYLPRTLPDPRSEQGLTAMADEMETLIRASHGRAFVLFTSWRTLTEVAPELARRLPWNVLIQGESGSRDLILETFREDTHSVLCGTRSFWEGVDVPGEALSLVIIDKMPFAPPSDPLLQARIKRCEELGGSGFGDIQLPEAIATLRQGAGRLIRSIEDRGVMALLDSRLYVKGYGREVVKNLPAAPIKDDLSEVRWFYEEAEAVDS